MRLKVSALGTEDHFNYCIIGTGPAGITCALSLARKCMKVALLEGGGLEYSRSSQDIYKGTVVGDPYLDLDQTRLRYFGGTSNHWGGWVRPLDPIDFEAKGQYRKTAWPIAKADLDPYLASTAKILEVAEFAADRPLTGSGLKQIDVIRSDPVRFAEKYSERLDSDPHIFLLLHANLTDLETNGETVTGARIVDPDGTRRRVRADRFILATGGIENSRLLLWSNVQTNGAMVKNAAALGKYWTDHPHFNVGSAFIARELLPADRFEMMFFAPRPQSLADDNILNFRLAFLQVSQTARHRGLKRLAGDIGCIAPELGKWAYRQIGRNLVCGGEIQAAWEQEPRAANRIELSGERDALGIPRPVLHWRKSETDFRTARVAARRLGAYLARANLGRMRLEPWVLGEADLPTTDRIAGPHHMGGTRMASSPAEGVVDANCKVFGQSNLYIAGSSVFPSGGYANPTFTIVQLALRLADHLRSTA